MNVCVCLWDEEITAVAVRRLFKTEARQAVLTSFSLSVEQWWDTHTSRSCWTTIMQYLVQWPVNSWHNTQTHNCRTWQEQYSYIPITILLHISSSITCQWFTIQVHTATCMCWYLQKKILFLRYWYLMDYGSSRLGCSIHWALFLYSH